MVKKGSPKTAKKPVSIWTKPLKANFQGLFKSLSEGVAAGIAFDWLKTSAKAVEALSFLGFEKDPASLAWLLVRRAMTQAIYDLIAESKDLLYGKSERVQAQLIERLDDLCETGRVVVLAGSLPLGLSQDSYASLIQRLTQHGALVALDTSGPALSAALAAPVLPFCIKPNRHELEQWAGKALPTLSDVTSTARALVRQGVQQVVVSLAEQGALFVGQNKGCWLASPPPITPASSVGAGDALLAGWLAAQHQGRNWQDAMRLALAFAAGKLGRIGPNLPDPHEVEHLAQAVTLSRVQDE